MDALPPAPLPEPSVSNQQAPRDPRGQPAGRPGGPLRPLVLGMDATLGSTLQTASPALPALLPPASTEACCLCPGHLLNLTPDPCGPPAAFLQCLVPPAFCKKLGPALCTEPQVPQPGLPLTRPCAPSPGGAGTALCLPPNGPLAGTTSPKPLPAHAHSHSSCGPLLRLSLGRPP